MNPHLPTLRTSTATLAVIGLVLLGCSDDEVAATTPAASAEPAPPDEAEDPAPDNETVADETIEVTLIDFAFIGLPDTVAAGTQLSVVNDADAELHELVAFRLAEDEGRSISELLQLPPDDLGAVLGEPTSVLLAEAGGPQIPAVGDGTLSQPGRYAILCFIPTGADPQEYLAAAAESDGPPRVDGGPPHFVQGMFADLTVK